MKRALVTAGLIATVVSALALPAARAASAAAAEAQAMLNRNDPNGALRVLDRYLATSPQDAEARFTRGLALVRLNRNEEAIKSFSELTRDYPQLPEPYNNLAVLYAQQGDYEKARDALEAALATHPSYATAHENLGDIYAALASAAYNRALMLDQSNAAVRYKLNLINQLDGTKATAASAPMPATTAVSAPAPTMPMAPPPMPAAMPVTSTPMPADTGVAGPAAALGPETTDAVSRALYAWTAAWSTKDVPAYLALYTPDFTPEGGVSRATWEAQRRERIRKPSHIVVKASSPEIVRTGASTVRVSFIQDYQSDAFSDQTPKVLDMRETPTGWKISREYLR